jgi:lactate dehydrogenase-like 2-hydroxyacid dehydrogenase
LRSSDYVSVNTFAQLLDPRADREAQLRLMKPTAFLINTARGPIVDQKALTRALAESGSRAPESMSSRRSRSILPIRSCSSTT